MPRYQTLTPRDVEIIQTTLADLPNSEIARIFKVRAQTVCRLRMDIDAIRRQAVSDEKNDHRAMMVDISPGCYYEYGYSPENLTGWERKTLIEGPKYSLGK